MPSKRRALVQLQPAALPKRLKEEGHTAVRSPRRTIPDVLPQLVFQFMGIRDWEKWFDMKTMEPLDTWVEAAFAEWGLGAMHVDWALASRNARPWMRALFRPSNRNVDWNLFTVLLHEWKLPLLMEAGNAGLFTWFHWRDLSIFSEEWMLPLFEAHPGKVSIKGLFRHGIDGPGRQMPFVKHCTEATIPEWKANFVKRHLGSFDWRLICRHGNRCLIDVFQEKFDDIIFSEFFQIRVRWKLDFLKTNKDRFDWANADEETWMCLSRDAEAWMPLEKHFNCLDVTLFAECTVRLMRLVRENADCVRWNENCSREFRSPMEGRLLQLELTRRITGQ